MKIKTFLIPCKNILNSRERSSLDERHVYCIIKSKLLIVSFLTYLHLHNSICLKQRGLSFRIKNKWIPTEGKGLLKKKQ